MVRQLSFSVQASSTIFSVNIADSVDAPALAIDIRELTALLSTEHQEGRWVVPEGGLISLYVQTVGADAVVYIGGYLLTN